MGTEEVEHPVPPEMRLCPKCGGVHFRSLDYESSATYEYLPGHFVRRIHKREKLSCSCGHYIVTAPAPPKLLPGSQYGFGFVAFLIVEKCADSIPIHRIEKRFGRLGIPTGSRDQTGLHRLNPRAGRSSGGLGRGRRGAGATHSYAGRTTNLAGRRRGHSFRKGG